MMQPAMAPFTIAFVRTLPVHSAPSSLVHAQYSCCPCLSIKKDDDDEDFFLQKELERIESLDKVMMHHDADLTFDDNDDTIDNDMWLEDYNDADDLEDFPYEEELQELERTLFGMEPIPGAYSSEILEEALRQGVVPADAGVGSGTMTGDFNFDPLHFAKKDYIGTMQQSITNLIPGGDDANEKQQQQDSAKRPTALVLRDYREAEIRHGRLAMLAAMFWPLQEMLDRLLLDDYGSVVGNLIKGGITLPYIPLIMTAIMLLLGYLDIFRQQLKESEELGEAFLPGDCFWDPLQILQGAPNSMKRNMQERELFNGRMAMLAVAVFIWEEVRTGLPIIDVPGNELLFEPAYQVPYIQEWLDSLFGSATPPTSSPFLDSTAVDVVEGTSLDELTGME